MAVRLPLGMTGHRRPWTKFPALPAALWKTMGTRWLTRGCEVRRVARADAVIGPGPLGSGLGLSARWRSCLAANLNRRTPARVYRFDDMVC